MSHVLIASVNLTSDLSTVTLSGIPQNYRDLQLVIDHSGSGVGPTQLRINGITSGQYNWVNLETSGNGTIYSSALGGDSSWRMSYEITPNAGRAIFIADFLDYTTLKNKSVLGRFGNGSSAVALSSLVVQTSNPITSITWYSSSVTFQPGSTFHLYGIEG